MGGLKFAGGNLRGDQGPAPCACDATGLLAVDYVTALCWQVLKNRDRLSNWPKRKRHLRWHTGVVARPVIQLMRPFPSAACLPLFIGDMRQEQALEVICRPSRAFRNS